MIPARQATDRACGAQTATIRKKCYPDEARPSSDFSIDLHRLDYGDILDLDLRKKADEAFEGSTVRPTSVMNAASFK